MCLAPCYSISILDKSTGEIRYKFSEKPVPSRDDFAYLIKCVPVPCGKCVECEQQYSTIWAYRIVMESSLYTDNVMITLTYKNSPGHLVKRDFQLFMKRLREYIAPLKVRYFACGEYGSKGGRPHYHCIIFGWKPSDMYVFFREKTYDVYRSSLVEKFWTLGYSTVQFVTYDVAKYCAKYLQKQQHYPAEYPPFTLMSLKPGIGLKAFNPVCLSSDKIYLDGKYIKIPRYFLDKAFENGYSLKTLKANRLLKASCYTLTNKQLRLRRERVLNNLYRNL